MQTDTSAVERPSHVPTDLVRDVDFYNLPGANDDVHLAWKKMADENPPLFWTPRNGGHWFATAPDDVVELQVNYADFSMTKATIPAGARAALPVESDPPYHTGLRAIISPLFSPDTLKGAQVSAKRLILELIDSIKGRGHCEFQTEFARHVPIVVFLELMDMPLKDKDYLLNLADIRFRSANAKERDDAKQKIIDYMNDAVRERREKPGKDFISKIIHAKIDGRPISQVEMEDLLGTVMSGGLDTVASEMGFVMRFLAMNPAHRQQLIDNPGLIPKAVDEFIRRHGVSNTARVITRDLTFRGVAFKKGERIMGPAMLYGLSAEKYADPLKVDFNRPDAGQHAAFGNGPHRCPGANLARLEVRIMLEEWLPRIPNFKIDPKKAPVMKSGIGNSLLSLPLVWDV